MVRMSDDSCEVDAKRRVVWGAGASASLLDIALGAVLDWQVIVAQVPLARDEAENGYVHIQPG